MICHFKSRRTFFIGLLFSSALVLKGHAVATPAPVMASHWEQGDAKPDVSGAYIDPRHLTTLPFGSHSHWLQPWRAYQETLPAQTFLKATGVVVNLLDKENPDLLIHMLARHGISNVRIEIGWGFVNFFDENQLNFSDRLKAMLLACKKYDVRPLILLNANEGVPTPTNFAERTLARKASRGDRDIELTNVSDLKVGYSGLANVTQSRASEILVVGIDGNRLHLSRPLPKNLGDAGTKVSLTTLMYRPFSAPDTQDYRTTMEGWTRYVGTVARFVTDTLGTKGEADVGFDMEIWNELTFGSAFLSINNYYEPKLQAYDENSIWRNLVRETAAYVTAHPADFRGVTLVDGFRNTIPWPAASQEPERIGAMSYHPYPGRKTYPADEQNGPAINALFAEEKTAFTPHYSILFPEYPGSALQTETAIRDMAPITTPIANVAHGRDSRVVNGKIVPCPLWFTETGFIPKEQGITDRNAALAIKAKTTARSTCFHVGKGLQRIYFYSALSGDTDLGIVQDNFGDYVRSHNIYPNNDAPYVSPALQTLGRITAKMRTGLDTKLITTRSLTVATLTDTHNHVQFQGDGSRAHPALFNRDLFVFVPFQVNARRFVIPYYVMTLDVTKALAPEEYTIRLQGVHGQLATVTAYDPLTNTAVPVIVKKRTSNELILILRAADAPYLLTIDEK